MALAPLVFDDIELWACDYLRPALVARSEAYTENVFVSNEIPKDTATGEPKRRDRMVIFRRDGGGRSRIVFDQPRLSADIWATTKDDAIDLARMVVALMEASPGNGRVKACELSSGPNRVADPSKQPRVYVTFNVTTLGRQLA
jgi:hypothetical protein